MNVDVHGADDAAFERNEYQPAAAAAHDTEPGGLAAHLRRPTRADSQPADATSILPDMAGSWK